jgi:flavin-dependent dehydrogenase
VSGAVDIAVVGGGVAGCAAALTVLRHTGLSVAVFERTSYQRARPGEHLALDALPILEYLGIDTDALLEPHVAGDVPSCAWESAALRAERPAFGGAARAWFVDRARLDGALADETRRRGADFVDASVRTVRLDRRARCWEITAESAAGALHRTARALVDASGSRALVARMFGASFVEDDALYAVTARMPGDASRLRGLIVEACADGWWYAVRVPGDVLVATFLTDRATMRRLRPADPDRWTDLAAATSHVARLVGRRRPFALQTVFVPSRRLSRAAGRGWIAAGDAALAADPISSMGIGFALHSGASAACALAAFLRGDPEPARVYAERLAATFDAYRVTRRSVYGAVTRWGDAPFWRARSAAAYSA